MHSIFLFSELQNLNVFVLSLWVNLLRKLQGTFFVVLILRLRLEFSHGVLLRLPVSLEINIVWIDLVIILSPLSDCGHQIFFKFLLGHPRWIRFFVWLLSLEVTIFYLVIIILILHLIFKVWDVWEYELASRISVVFQIFKLNLAFLVKTLRSWVRL